MIRQPEREQLNRLTVKALDLGLYHAGRGLRRRAGTQAAHTLVTRYYTSEAPASQSPTEDASLTCRTMDFLIYQNRPQGQFRQLRQMLVD